MKKPRIVSIEQLNARRAGDTFQGDVLVVYKATLDKANKTREMLCANLIDHKAEMTITLNVSGNLVYQHEPKIVPGSAISILDFQVAPRTDYDRGDCDCILILTAISSTKNISRLCQEYKFIPSATISQLLTTVNEYPAGTIAALVVGAKKMGTQFAIDIKDGHTDIDRAQVFQST